MERYYFGEQWTGVFLKAGVGFAFNSYTLGGTSLTRLSNTGMAYALGIGTDYRFNKSFVATPFVDVLFNSSADLKEGSQGTGLSMGSRLLRVGLAVTNR